MIIIQKRILGVCLWKSFQKGSTDQTYSEYRHHPAIYWGARLWNTNWMMLFVLSCFPMLPDMSKKLLSLLPHPLLCDRLHTRSEWCEKTNPSSHKLLSVRYFVSETNKQNKRSMSCHLLNRSSFNVVTHSPHSCSITTRSDGEPTCLYKRTYKVCFCGSRSDSFPV